MATFRLNDWHSWSPLKQRKRIRLPAADTSTAVLVDWVLTAGLCIGLAALVPAPVTIVALAALFSLAGYVWLAFAIVRAGSPTDRQHLTAWDAALLSFVASFSVQTAAHLGAFSP